MIDWNAIATPPRPATVEFARMARLTLQGHAKPSHDEFSRFMDLFDLCYFGATDDWTRVFDNRRALA